MSADHRKPVVAFIVLAVLAAALVGFQRADARTGQFFASLLGVTGQVEGTLPLNEIWTADGAVVTQPSVARRVPSAETDSHASPRARGAEARSGAPRVHAGKAGARRHGSRAEARGPGGRVAAGLHRSASGVVGRHARERSAGAAIGSPGQAARAAAHRVTRGGPDPKSLRKRLGHRRARH